MKIANETDITSLITADPWMMKVLQAAQTLDLPDWWIGAGFLRNKVWDAIESNQSRPTKDVDLVYFNASDLNPETDWSYDERLKVEFPFAEWEVRNQARMHYVNGFAPYSSTTDGMAHWVETATCVGVKLHNGTLSYVFCHGTDDLFGLIARPSPAIKNANLVHVLTDRVASKGWQKKWPHLQVRLE